MPVRSPDREPGDIGRALAGVIAATTPPARLDVWPPSDVCRAAEHHGVVALVVESAGRDDARPWLDCCRRRAVELAATDVVREIELREVLAACHAGGVRPVLFKGAALAYSQYTRPDLRPRLDSDLLVAPADRAGATAVLRSLGYREAPHAGGDLVSYQATFVAERDSAAVHVIDLHWRIANPQVFGHVLTYDDVRREAVALPALSPYAWGAGTVHALLLACVHRIAHHAETPMLIWLYDIDRLARALDDEGWRRFASLAAERGVDALCLRSLEAARAQFGTPVPPAVLAGAVGSRERAAGTPLSAYIAGSRPLTRVWWDLRTLPTWRARARLMKQHVFPPAQYMRVVYAPASSALLPWLYARRAWRGARKWLVKQ